MPGFWLLASSSMMRVRTHSFVPLSKSRQCLERAEAWTSRKTQPSIGPHSHPSAHFCQPPTTSLRILSTASPRVSSFVLVFHLSSAHTNKRNFDFASCCSFPATRPIPQPQRKTVLLESRCRSYDSRPRARDIRLRHRVDRIAQRVPTRLGTLRPFPQPPNPNTLLPSSLTKPPKCRARRGYTCSPSS